MTETTDSVVLRYELGWEDVREVMATSRILVLMRRSWTVAGFMFAGLAGRVGRAAAHRRGQARRLRFQPGIAAGELIAAACLCGAARVLERAAGVAAVARAPGPPRARQRRLAERDPPVQAQRRGRGLEGARRIGRLPALVRADRRTRDRAAVPPARSGWQPCAGVRPEDGRGRPAGRPRARD